MQALSQLLHHRRGNTLIKGQAAGAHGVVIEARYQVLGLKARRLNGVLGIGAPQGSVKKHLQQSLILIVAAGSAERQQRPVGIRDQRGAERDARSLARA
jgi:hypothetical protein